MFLSKAYNNKNNDDSFLKKKKRFRIFCSDGLRHLSCF